MDKQLGTVTVKILYPVNYLREAPGLWYVLTHHAHSQWDKTLFISVWKRKKWNPNKMTIIFFYFMTLGADLNKNYQWENAPTRKNFELFKMGQYRDFRRWGESPSQYWKRKVSLWFMAHDSWSSIGLTSENL